jgi:hypothetical protein
MELGAIGRPGSLFSRAAGAPEGMRRARVRATAPRYVAAAVAVLLLALGLRSIVMPPKAVVTPVPASADAPSRSFALQFARAYLTYDASRPAVRARALAALLPANLDRGGGAFPEAGRQRVLWAEVASDQPALVGGRVITVAAGVSTQAAPVYLAVPVRHPTDRPVSLAGYPSFVGAPLVDHAGSSSSYSEVDDPAVEEVVGRVLRNYLAGSAENLKADLADEAEVTLPTVDLQVENVDQLVWLGGTGSGAVLATVLARDARRVIYTLTYEIGIAYWERPYVTFISVIPTGS